MSHKSQCKCKTKKLPEDNVRENLDNLGYGNDLLDTKPKALPMKRTTDKLDFIKIKQKQQHTFVLHW